MASLPSMKKPRRSEEEAGDSFLEKSVDKTDISR
jgi:hypothetical protein